jgi:hypothetical protein
MEPTNYSTQEDCSSESSRPNLPNDQKVTPKQLWNAFKEIINHGEFQKLTSLMRYHSKWSPLIETLINLAVAGLLILVLLKLVDNQYIDRSSFGVMFGTVFGYLLSWRFGK